MAHILIIEDDKTFSLIIEGFLKKHGHQTSLAQNLKEGDRYLQTVNFDLLLLDYRLPDGTGMDIFSKSYPLNTLVPVIIMTSFHDIRTAVKAMRSGAFDYITKPVNPDELLMVVEQALHKKEPAVKVAEKNDNFIKGISEVSKALYEHINLVGPTAMSVLIQGESGTGKEHVARMIHQTSKRSSGPFISIDCGALSTELATSELFGHTKGAFTGAMQDKQGLFEAAHGGTLFLDEVGNLSYEVQVKLLRALQEREIQPVGSNRTVKVDVRIITATNDDLQATVKKGGFREDLYHRLNEFKIKLPALRERTDDRDLFISHFIGQANKELDKKIKGLSAEVRTIFRNYDWPGNLRELKNIIKRAVLLSQGDEITLRALPEEMVQEAAWDPGSAGPDLKAAQAVNERELILKTLKDVKYNKSKAAKLLNIDRKTLYYKMAKYGIE